MAQMESISMEDLKNTPCIIIAPKHQEMEEETYYREYLGVKSEFLFAETIEEVHLMVAMGRGYLPMDFNQPPENMEGVRFIPLLGGEKQLYCEYYAFWPVDANKDILRDFAAILHSHFSAESVQMVREENN